MTLAKKIGIILILVGICLPTATMPFITEFRPQPDICLTSNFFANLGNMMVVIGAEPAGPGTPIQSSMVNALVTVPYRYLFSSGVIIACIGVAIIVLSLDTIPARKK